MTTYKTELTKIREKIDALDLQIQHLLNERAQCVLKVAKIKQNEQQEPTYYRPERVAIILRKLMKRNKGPMPSKAMAEIFLQILAQCLALEQPIKIAIPAHYKTIATKAVHKQFGHSSKPELVTSIRKIFQHIQNKKIHYGIVPVEDNKTGKILETLNQFLEFPLQICGEIVVKSLRFLIVGRESPAPSGDDKTTLVIFVANKPGSLAHILDPFARHHIDVSFVEYFPYQGNPHNYVFFLDLAGHQQDEKIKNALNDLAKQSLSYVLLGSYPKVIL